MRPQSRKALAISSLWAEAPVSTTRPMAPRSSLRTAPPFARTSCRTRFRPSRAAAPACTPPTPSRSSRKTAPVASRTTPQRSVTAAASGSRVPSTWITSPSPGTSRRAWAAAFTAPTPSTEPSSLPARSRSAATRPPQRKTATFTCARTRTSARPTAIASFLSTARSPLTPRTSPGPRHAESLATSFC